ncbi:MAG: hypothetical protein U0S36_12290 [Candidatus Nanopelagicales bacterium]
MSELGCGGDWDGACDLTDLAPEAGSDDLVRRVHGARGHVAVERSGSTAPGTSATATPAVRSTGQQHAAVAAGLRPAAVRVRRRHAPHLGRAGRRPRPGYIADRALAGTSLRKDLTRERFYFVMADRFANGSTANDQGGLTGSRLETGFDPTDKGFYHGGDLRACSPSSTSRAWAPPRSG